MFNPQRLLLTNPIVQQQNLQASTASAGGAPDSRCYDQIDALSETRVRPCGIEFVDGLIAFCSSVSSQIVVMVPGIMTWLIY